MCVSGWGALSFGRVKDVETMTDPTSLTHDQLCQYVRQLQQTVVFWQDACAMSRGQTRDQMIEFLKSLPREVPAKEIKGGIDADWLADA